MDLWKYAIAGFIQPFFWLIVLGVALWLTRRFMPRAERTLFDPISVSVPRLWRRLLRR